MCNVKEREPTLGFQSNSAKMTNAAAVSVIAALQADENSNISLSFMGSF